MRKTVKSPVPVLLAFMVVLGILGCDMIDFKPYKQENSSGWKQIDLRSPQKDQDPALKAKEATRDVIFMNRLAFGVSSRKITLDRLPVVVNQDTGPNTNFKPWGNIIRDSDDTYDPFVPDPNKGAIDRQLLLTSINETCNAGKIAGSEDGISYYFWEVPADTNFRISGDFYVNSFGFTAGRAELNGQEAFGFMARDWLPQHTNVGDKKYDLTMAGLKGGAQTYGNNGDTTSTVPGGHVPWNGVYWNGQGTALNDGCASSSNMIMVGGVKRGTRVYWRTGVTDPDGQLLPVTDPNVIANADFAKFNYWPREFSDYSEYGTGIEGTKNRPDFPSAGLTYSLYLERTNSGFVAKIIPPAGKGKGMTKNRLPKDGEVLHYTDRELAFPDMLANSNSRNLPKAKQPVNLDKYYVGFFVARDAEVVISNFKYEESPADKCAARIDPIPAPVTPTFSVQSPDATSSEDYILYARSNVEGVMALSINGSEPIIYSSDWIVETSNASAEPFALFEIKGIKLKKGDNIFDMKFIPDTAQYKSGYLGKQGDKDSFEETDEYLMTSTAAINRSFTVTRRELSTAPDPKYSGTNGYMIMYVAPNGKSTGDGTYNDPLDIATAIAVSAPGQMIILKDGIYTPLDKPELVMDKQRTPIRLRIPRYNSGLANTDPGAPTAPWKVLNPPTPAMGGVGPTSPYYYWNDPYYKYYKVIRAENRDKAIFDFRKDLAERGYAPRNFEHNGDRWVFDGFHVRNCYDTYVGLKIGGSHNLAQWIKTYFNGDTGFIIQGSAADPKSVWPANNRIEYCESFGNADLARTNADGFAAKLTVWEGNVFYRTISHHNIDDGYDLFAKKETGPIGALHIEQCFAYFNGRYLNDEMGYNYSDAPNPADRPKRNNSAGVGGNGFKMGGEGIPVLHHSIDCLSFGNDGDGFTSNSDPAIRLTHVTAFNNYNRVDTNPGGNIVIYSASSPSYEGLDAIIAQVFSWHSGHVLMGRGFAGDPDNRLFFDDLMTIKDPDPDSPTYGQVHPNSVRGKRNDRVEPKSPSSGYIWRNYVPTLTALHPYVPGTQVQIGVFDGNNGNPHRGMAGKSVSTLTINGKGDQNIGGVESKNANIYIDNREWTIAGFWEDPHELLKTGAMFTNDGLAPWWADPSGMPYERMGRESQQRSGVGGKVEGEFFYVYDGAGHEGYRLESNPYYWGLPVLDNFMKLKDDPSGITPGARGLWK